MSAAESNLLHIVHITAALMLVGYTFYAFAAAPERRRSILALSGIASLLVLLTGVRMWQSEFLFVRAGWIFTKIACWLALSMFAGMAFRRRAQVGKFAFFTILLAATAVTLAYLKPF